MSTQKLSRAWSSLQKRGITESYRSLRRHLRAKGGQDANAVRILLITNRDSDNVGDQVIEECATSLVRTALNELGVANYRITSRAAGMISKRYLQTRNEALLADPEAAIEASDIVLFGGSPLFNYRYQPFYERTAVTLELAQKHHKPVLFSAIGVEDYDEDDERCQRLKKALALPCVNHITTRDNYEALERFVEGLDIPIAKVSDPAVAANLVFRPFIAKQPTDKVGIFVIREHAFHDNGIDLARDQAAQLWLSLAKALEDRGIDYEFISSGHFSDEAFLELLVTDYHVPVSKCVFNMNAPEDLVQRISSYRAVVSCRLHPSIIAYALSVPSIGVTWNDKVPQFYAAIGYPQRVAHPLASSGADLAQRVIAAMEEGVRPDPAFRISNYASLRDGLARALGMTPPALPPTLDQLGKSIVPFSGTSAQEREAKLQRKFRRAYAKYNAVAAQNERLKTRTHKLKRKLAKYESK